MVITPKERQRVACLVRLSDHAFLGKFDGPRSFWLRHTRDARGKGQINFKPIGLLLKTNYPSGGFGIEIDDALEIAEQTAI